METIFLLSKTYIDGDDVLNKIEEIAQRMGNEFINDNEISINQYIDDDNISRITFGGLFLDYFNETLQGKNFIDGYGCEMSINYHSNGDMLLPFLKEFLKEYPDMLLYKETGGKSSPSNPFVYNKEHFDNYSGTDYYALLDNPPQENLT